MSAPYIPTAYNLLSGNPFTYDAESMSTESLPEVFVTGIDARDARRCIVCGHQNRRGLECTHIIPQVEDDTV